LDAFMDAIALDMVLSPIDDSFSDVLIPSDSSDFEPQEATRMGPSVK
jgi:hypothetical protein